MKAKKQKAKRGARRTVKGVVFEEVKVPKKGGPLLKTKGLIQALTPMHNKHVEEIGRVTKVTEVRVKGQLIDVGADIKLTKGMAKKVAKLKNAELSFMMDLPKAKPSVEMLQKMAADNLVELRSRLQRQYTSEYGIAKAKEIGRLAAVHEVDMRMPIAYVMDDEALKIKS